MQKQKKKGKFPPFSAFFFSFFGVFFPFAWEEEDAIIFFFHFFVFVWSEEGDDTNVPLPFLFLLFFVMNKSTTTSLFSNQNFPFLPTSPLLPTYLNSFCAHSIVRAQESKQEGRRGRIKLRARSKRAKVAAKKKCLKWKDKSKKSKVGG